MNTEATQRFYDLVLPQLPLVMRTASILVGNRADAEDLAQETMLKAFKALGRFQDGTDIRAWLLAILRHARIDRLRSQGRRAADVSLEGLAADFPATLQADSSPGCPARVDDLMERFSDAQVIEALQKLPEEIRWTLLFTDVEGLAQEEAAAILSVPVGTIKSRAHRGRAMLRQALLPAARERRLAREE